MTAPRGGMSTSSGAWTAAVIVIAISLLSTFTLSNPSSTTVNAAGSGSGGGASAGSKKSTSSKCSTSAKKDSSASTTTTTKAPKCDSSSSSGSSNQASGSSDSYQSGGGGDGFSSGSGGSSADGSTDGGDESIDGGSSDGGSSSDGSSGGGGGGGGGGTTDLSPSAPGDLTGPPAGSPGAASCANHQNNGATDWGVTGNSINFAATVVLTGIAKAFLADAQYGIEAIRQKVNRAGGICGRLINVHYDDDGWDPGKGQQLIEGYIGSHNYFGLAVNPSSEGLRNAIKARNLDDNHFPVIGADGMLIGQYQDPWVWPVATSTHSVMHVMAREAYARGARHAGIVWDSSYRFGKEGRDAFVGEFTRLGGTIASEKSVQGGQADYSAPAGDFLGGCGGNGRRGMQADS